MREFIIILCASMLIASCKKASEDDVETSEVEIIQPRDEDVQAISNILENAATTQLNKPRSLPTGRAHEEAQAIFEDFWNPKMLKRYGEHEWRDELYADSKYLILQRSLVVATKKTDGWPLENLKYMYRHFRQMEDDWTIETITDFQPTVSIPDTTVLSLTNDLYDELQAFLGSSYSKATTPDIMSPAQAAEESRMKHIAANTMTRIYSKHWGDGWHLISHPEVEHIQFDKDYQHAVVAFRIVYQGGYAFYDKTPEGWKLSESAITWIE